MDGSILSVTSVLILVLSLAALPVPADSARAQAPPDTTAASPSQLRVFLDCPGRVCDASHIRRQISYVSWVRDRQASDVQVLVTREATAGGGERITFDFLGRGRFQGEERRLRYTASASEPEHDTRSAIVRLLEQGLVGFLARTPTGEQIDIRYAGSEAGEEAARAADDPWNRWVFSTSASTFLNGGGRRTIYNLDGGISSNRTTKQWKIDLGASGNYQRSEFLIPRDGDTTEIVTTEERYSVRALAVNSLGSHWSVGGFSSVRHSTRRNQELATSVGPAVEFNLFPYSESTRRQLTVLYSLTANTYDYQTPTIFDRTSEERLRHTLNVSLDVTEPWGEVGVSLEGRHFLNDIEQNRLTLSGNLSLQIVEGLSIDAFGSGSRVRDQIYLSRREVDPEDVFTGQREFATDFEYFARVGLSYTFGSDLSDVVNTRFDELGGGGGGMIIF